MPIRPLVARRGWKSVPDRLAHGDAARRAQASQVRAGKQAVAGARDEGLARRQGGRADLQHFGRQGGSLFDSELRQCADSAAVLRVGGSTRLPLGMEDLRAFTNRLVALGKVPRSGGDLHGFVSRVQAALPALGAEAAHLALVRFAELSVRQAALAAWPLFLQHAEALPPAHLADGIWAVSAVPTPPNDVVLEATALAAGRLAPHVAELPPVLLYRSTYGLARLAGPRRCGEFWKRAERAAMSALRQRGPCVLGPSQLVRMCWAFARRGPPERQIFEALGPRLRAAVPELKDTELEALYSMLTELELVGQWRLIHDIERAMEARQQGPANEKVPGGAGAAPGAHKKPRKRLYARKWSKVSLTRPLFPNTRGGKKSSNPQRW
ncbi:unnamed protein product [Prorocentrum cordatum]|uniref:Uncharacterized protein n=1 Tax=Prorocentrum cordatum TaxID=2364126 RepID=A0ABN9VK82_9DINO|nr:unnamed protein product [Polarella glacialis]